MNPPIHTPTLHSTVPASRLYWTVIDAPGVRGGMVPAGLWPEVEDDLPLPLEELWAVCAPMQGSEEATVSKLAVCAIPRIELAERSAGALTLVPDALPEFISSSSPSAFNFLIGPFEPVALRRKRTHLHLAAAACTLVTASLVAVGLSRRAERWQAEATAAETASRSIVAAIANKPVWTRDDLTLELMQRRQTPSSDLAPPRDAAAALASVIARWPSQIASKPQSISATGQAASISVTIPGDAQPFLTSLKPPEGWTLDEPRLVAIDKTTRVNLELRREVSAEPGGLP